MNTSDRPSRLARLAPLLGLLVLVATAAARTPGAAGATARPAAPLELFLPVVRTPLGLQGTLFASGFTNYLTSITNRGTERLVVTERQGRVRLVQGDGSLAATPFLDITDRVESGFVEQGLLGLAFHPDHETNGLFFVTYTDLAGELTVSRFAVLPGGDPDQADPDSEVVLLTVPQHNANHNGGALVFGPDGYLYVGAGDAGHGLMVDIALNPAYLRGKILRLDVDGGEPYAIPPDNPYVGVDGAREEVFAVGLRNPWHMAFDPATGDLYIGDVGEDNWEEVNLIPAGTSGQNFGWPCYEAKDRLVLPTCGPESDYTFPIFAFPHVDGACSIIGGAVYRGAQMPELSGVYVFADFCTGRAWGLVRGPAPGWQSLGLGQLSGELTTFGVTFDGEMVYAAGQMSRIFRLGPDE